MGSDFKDKFRHGIESEEKVSSVHHYRLISTCDTGIPLYRYGDGDVDIDPGHRTESASGYETRWEELRRETGMCLILANDQVTNSTGKPFIMLHIHLQAKYGCQGLLSISFTSSSRSTAISMFTMPEALHPTCTYTTLKSARLG